MCRHHHRAFARSVISALNLREISATSALAEIAPPFRISPTDPRLADQEKRFVQTTSSDVCSVSHLRCPESAGNLSHQRTRRNRAALPDFSHRFRTPQIRKRDLCRHHHRAFGRSAICGAPNLRENLSHQRLRQSMIFPAGSGFGRWKRRDRERWVS